MRLPVIKSTNRGPIGKEILSIAEADYLYVLREIAMQEIAAQIGIGNNPTNVIVDGRKGKPILQATKSVVAYFADGASMIQAITDAYNVLQQKGRRVTGATLGAARFYQQTGRNAPIQVGGFNKDTITRATDLYVAVPVAHVRKWQWLSKTGRRMTRKTKDKQQRSGAMVSKSIVEVVAAIVKRKYRHLDVLPTYIPVYNLNIGGKTKVDRIPAVKVRMKLRGKL